MEIRIQYNSNKILNKNNIFNSMLISPTIQVETMCSCDSSHTSINYRIEAKGNWF